MSMSTYFESYLTVGVRSAGAVLVLVMLGVAAVLPSSPR